CHDETHLASEGWGTSPAELARPPYRHTISGSVQDEPLAEPREVVPWEGLQEVVIMPGPAPKPPTKRRNRGTPKSWGAAEPVTAPAASTQDRELGIEDPHQLVASMWTSVQNSADSRFYSEADWARLRMELWNANELLSSGKP